MAHEINHLELRSTKVDKTSKFYKELFGWKLRPMPEMSYTMFTEGNGVGGGIMQLEKKAGPSHWVHSVQVKHIDASAKRAKKLGAKVLADVMQVPGYGRIAVPADPSGHLPA